MTTSSSATTSEPAPTCEPAPKTTKQLPPWKLILHNDDVNTAEYVVNKVQEITKLDEEVAVQKVLEADKEGLALLLTTHKEKAELLVEMFESCKIDVTMEKV